MTNFGNITLFAAALCLALMAGLFFAYSCSVNPGLSRLPDAEYLSAMQNINRAILNPAFFVPFFGTLILLPVSAFMNNGQPDPPKFWLLAAASVVYALGLFGVTVMGNVPLNEMLAGFSIKSATPDAIAAQRLAFEGPWNRWHLIRTIAVCISLILVLWACLLPARK